MTETKTEWYIIVNPHAGSGKTIAEWEVAEKKLFELEIPYVSVFTDHKYHAAELAAKAASRGYRRILAVGGDGSVHEAFCGLMLWCEEHGVAPEDFTLGVIPIGSGNDWIKSLDVPHDTEEVIELIAKGYERKQDVVRVLTRGGKVSFMANIGGVGFDSHVCARVNAQKEAGKRSKRIYVSSLFHTILNLKSFHARIEGDGEIYYEGPCFSVAFGNGRYSGSGMRQTAGAEIDDGLVDVLIVPVVSIFRIVKEIHRIFDGSIQETDCLIYKRCRSLKMTPLNARSSDIVEMDGEIVGNLPLEINVTGKQINAVSGKPAE